MSESYQRLVTKLTPQQMLFFQREYDKQSRSPSTPPRKRVQNRS
jgi:hypothetical protein